MSHCLAQSDPEFDPRKCRDFKFLTGTGIRRNGNAELQSLVSVPNIPGLNTKYLRCALVKVCVLLIAICLSDGHVKHGGTLGAFG